MKIVFWAADKSRETLLAEALAKGVAKHGDTCETRLLTSEKTAVEPCDVACMVGVKSHRRFQAHREAGVPVIYFDKGYVRARDPKAPGKFWEYWRVSINAHQPTAYIMRHQMWPDRFKALGLEVKARRLSGDHVIFAGSSEKYHTFMGLPHPTKYAKGIVKRLRALSERPIIYRPKPSWHDAVPVEGAGYSAHPQRLGDLLNGAHALVTHGSNACFEAVLAGVPCIILGDAVAKPLSDTELDSVNGLMIWNEVERAHWLANLAYCQWTMDEFESGEAWGSIRATLLEAIGQ